MSFPVTAEVRALVMDQVEVEVEVVGVLEERHGLVEPVRSDLEAGEVLVKELKEGEEGVVVLQVSERV